MSALEHLKGKTLLVVEDEEDLREPLVMEFERLGCRVFEARNGVEGFAIVCSKQVDLVISDIRMPGGGGIEMLTRIRGRDCEVPVVMLISGFSGVSREEAYEFGAESILPKPFDLDEIESAADKLLQPAERRWAQAAASVERRHVAKHFTCLLSAQREGQIRLGRGGLFLAQGQEEQRRGSGIQPVSFSITFESGDLLLIEGTGIVRWGRSVATVELSAGVGIEFETLSDQCRPKVIETLRGAPAKPYLPRGHKLQVQHVVTG